MKSARDDSSLSLGRLLVIVGTKTCCRWDDYLLSLGGL